MLKTVGFPSTRTGDQTIVDGNLVIATSGKGIDFSATSGTGTSELLADYEEGTWTPTITATVGSITSYTSSGTYTKIGRQVTIVGNFLITNNGTGSSQLRMGSLPVAATNADLLQSAGREYSAVGFGWVGGGVTTTQMLVAKPDGTYAGGTNYGFTVVATYFV